MEAFHTALLVQVQPVIKTFPIISQSLLVVKSAPFGCNEQYLLLCNFITF